jgi:cobalt-zinc-cadmium efflux system outer membrane protein
MPLEFPRIPFLVISLSLIAACASTSSTPSAPSQQPSWPSTPEGASARGLADAVRAQFLERESYVRAVLQVNPSIEAARQGWRAALARVRQAGAFEDPMLELSLAPLSIGSANARLGYEVGLTQPLPWFGKRGLERDVSAAEAPALQSDFEATRRSLALTALALYDQYYVMVRSLEVNAHHVELLRAVQDAASSALETGRGSAQDVLQAEAELAHLEHDSAVLAAELDVAIAQMNELLHRDPESALPPPPPELRLRTLPATRNPKTFAAEALDARPEIASARHHVRAEQARVRKAERDSYPDLTLSTSYNSMWDMPEHRWMVRVGLSLPLALERRAGAVDEGRALRAQFESEAARLADQARAELFIALRKLRESEHVLGIFERRLLPVARDRIEASRAGFIASQNSFAALIEAEKNLRSVELEYHVARAECDRRYAELERALGRIPGLGEPGATP